METIRDNKHPCAGAQKSKLSKPQAGIFINNENNLDSTMETMRDNKHPCASAQKSKLSKLKFETIIAYYLQSFDKLKNIAKTPHFSPLFG